MRPTDDIAPLVDIAEREFERLAQEATMALTALSGFWTRLYGPNEAFVAAFDELEEMQREWEQVPA